MRESKIMSEIRDKLSHGLVRLFRNNTGVGLAIQHKHPYTRQALISACIALAEKGGGTAQRIRFGLAVGSGDLIGWRQVLITPEMVGMTVAQVVSCEVKTDRGAVKMEQSNWMAAINGAGGLAFVARSVEEAKNNLSSPIDNPLSGGARSTQTNTGDKPK